MLTDTPKYARVSAVAREFGLSASTLRRLADRGDVRAIRLGSHRFFERASVAEFLSDYPHHSEGGDVQRPAVTRPTRTGRCDDVPKFREHMKRFRAKLQRERREAT